ncbi:MAG TPA: futalosine hydrolase [Thermodesulfovibrionales bacterium]|nr:futalosine hydrolase [Thermodesulfovibrionales bacterium]
MSSVPDEGKQFIKLLKKKSLIGGKAVYQGAIGDKSIAYMISGMGKTNAAHAATILIERFSPDLLILFGVGGAYPSSGLGIGDIAFADEEIYGDEGVSDKNGFHGTEFIGIPLLQKGRRKYFNEFAFDKKLIGKALDSYALCPMPHAQIKSGAFVTVSTCTGTRKRAFELRKKYHAICENMEGASVAHICAIYGTPMVEVRGISNIVEDRNREKWNIKLASENCQKVVLELLKRYRKAR